MITFFVCLALLLIGYATYGAFVEKVFHPDDRETQKIRADLQALPYKNVIIYHFLAE